MHSRLGWRRCGCWSLPKPYPIAFIEGNNKLLVIKEDKRADYYDNLEKDLKDKLQEADNLTKDYDDKINAAETEIEIKRTNAVKEIAEVREAAVKEAKTKADEIVADAYKKAEMDRKRMLDVFHVKAAVLVVEVAIRDV